MASKLGTNSFAIKERCAGDNPVPGDHALRVLHRVPVHLIPGMVYDKCHREYICIDSVFVASVNALRLQQYAESLKSPLRNDSY